MHIQLRYLTGILCGLLLLQCQKDVELSFDDFRPKLVVNAQLAPDKTIEVSVTSSASPVSAEIGIIPDGLSLELRDRTLDVTLDLYREASTFIAPHVYPRPGHVYEIKASAPGFQTVVASTTIPEFQKVHNASIEDYQLLPSESTEGKFNLSYDLNLNTGKSSGQFLHVLFWQQTSLNVGSIEAPDYEDFIYAIEPQFPEESGYLRHPEQGVLVDMMNSGGQELLFSFRDYTLGEFEQIGDLIVEVRTVSPEYYLYFSSLTRQLITREDPFAEPIPTFNNVDYGLGNFSSYHVERFSVNLQ